jgi:glycosyltransferase involved in cell wall biosynthesis
MILYSWHARPLARRGITAKCEKTLIYVCIPVHDEARTIGILLWKIRKVMMEFGRDYEILVLNDGSGDDTAETLKRYQKSVPMTVIEEKAPVGYARGVEKLIRLALRRTNYPKRDSVVTIQGDFTESPEHITSLVKTLEGGADVVTGTVEAGRATVPRPQRLARMLAPFLLGKTHRAAPVSDPLCGFRAYRLIVLKKALRALGEGRMVSGEGWAANLQMLGLSAAHARRIEEVPLDLRYDIRERGSRFNALRTLRGLMRVRNGKMWAPVES